MARLHAHVRDSDVNRLINDDVISLLGVCWSVYTECIVAKRCVLEQKLLVRHQDCDSRRGLAGRSSSGGVKGGLRAAGLCVVRR